MNLHEEEQLRCECCGLVTGWFHGWSFTVGRDSDPVRLGEPAARAKECRGKESSAVTGGHRWNLEAKPS